MDIVADSAFETKAGVPHDAVVTHGELMRAFEAFKETNDERLTRRDAWCESVDRALMTATVRAVATVAALYPGRARCLEQSMTLYWMFRRRGVGVRLRLGAQPYPFEAHAWIEYRGEPLSEDREQL